MYYRIICHRADRLHGKLLDPSQVLPSGGLRTGTTHKLASTSLHSPEKCCPNCSIHSKDIQFFPQHEHKNESPLFHRRMV